MPELGSDECAESTPLDAIERGQLDLIRRFGTVGALLLAAGSLGAGASPVFNPVSTVPVFGLFTRLPTVALSSAVTGMGMVLIAWLWLGRFVRPGRTRLLSRTQLERTLVMWVAPLVLVPPMFSRDVYSYLAQSKIAFLGLNPYELGPASALGVADPLTRGVPNLWRETPAPYGPLFLTVGRGISALIGDHVVTGALLHRALELLGVVMIVWALPRLARRCGVQPVSALWLGAANPLVIWHLVVGSHNEALMVGLMMIGFELAVRRMPRVGKGEPVPPLTRGEVGYLLLGAAVITLGAAVKITAAPALGFLGVLLARRLGGKLRHLVLAAMVMLGVAVVVLVAASLGTGLGFGWINALGVPGVVRSWISPMTAIGFLSGGLGILLGLGNHAEAAVDGMRVLGTAITGLICVKLLWDTYRGRVEPLFGLGACLAAVVAFGATVQPWYLLWAVPLLAAATRPTRLRTAVAVISAIFSLLVPPTGSTFDGHVYVVPEAYFAAIIVLATAMYVLRKRIPILPPGLLAHSGTESRSADPSASGADSGRVDKSDRPLPTASR